MNDGTLKIYACLTVMRGTAVMQMMRLVSTVHYVSKNEAELMAAEHRKQVTESGDRVRYEYQWQSRPVEL